MAVALLLGVPVGALAMLVVTIVRHPAALAIVLHHPVAAVGALLFGSLATGAATVVGAGLPFTHAGLYGWPVAAACLIFLVIDRPPRRA